MSCYSHIYIYTLICQSELGSKGKGHVQTFQVQVVL